MKRQSKTTAEYLQAVGEIVFPVILLLLPLLKINQGVDLTDTPYSLGNYRFLRSRKAFGCYLPFCPM